jgi:hypothetical protein
LAYDARCAYGVSRGGKVPGNPNLWRIVDDKLYLNITLAGGNWPQIEPADASGKQIPKFTSEAPEGS